MNIAVIGRGQVGGGLADRWERVGHRVVRLGRDGGDASGADALLIAVPSSQIGDALHRITGLHGTIALDATNAYDGRDDRFESLAHQVKSITGGPVSKTFNLQYAALYAHLDQQRVRPSNLYATDPEAGEVTELLIRDAGYDPVYIGGLAYARMLEDATGIFRTIRLQGLGLYFHRYARPGDL